MPAPGECACSWGGVFAVCSRGGAPAPGGAYFGGCLLQGVGGDPPGMATAADGTHPTVMHYCMLCYLLTSLVSIGLMRK